MILGSSAALLIAVAIVAVLIVIGGPTAVKLYHEYKAFKEHQRERKAQEAILEEQRLNEQIWSPPPSERE